MEETKAPWHGEPIGPSGHLKVSLNEPVRQEMQQSVECYIIHWNLYTNRVSKPSIPEHKTKKLRG